MGIVIEYLSLAASRWKHTLSLTTKCDLSESQISAIITFRAAEEITIDPLYSHLRARETDRRKFKGGDINDKVFHDILQLSTNYSLCDVRIRRPKGQTFARAISILDTIPFTWERSFKDIAQWIRFKSSDEIIKSGLLWKNLGIKFHEAILIFLIMRFPIIFKVLNFFRWDLAIRKNGEKNMSSGAGFILFSLPAYNTDALIETGRLVTRSWIMLCRDHYGVQPHSLGTFPLTHLMNHPDSKLVPENIKKLYQETEALYQQEFNLPNGHFPIFLLYTGISSPLPTSMKTSRFSVTEMLRP